MAKILIKNGRVWDGEKFFYSDVLTDGEYVSKIAPSISEDATFVLDAENATVSAGFVDTHTHLRGVSSSRYGTQAEMSCFPFGVTSAADGGACNGSKELLESFMLKAVVFIAAKIKDNKSDFSDAQRLLSLYGNKVAGIKSYFDQGVSDIRDVTPLKEICDFAHPKTLSVMVHCTDSPLALSEILGVLKSGDILTHAFNGSVNNAEVDGFESMLSAQKRGVFIDVGFAGNVHADFGIMKRAIEKGIIPDCISTDITRLSAFVRGGRYGMTECMSISKALGMTESDIFRAVTSNPAKALRKDSEWGYLKEGRKADVTVIKEDAEAFSLTDKNQNTVSGEKSYRCKLTVSNGQIVYKD